MDKNIHLLVDTMRDLGKDLLKSQKNIKLADISYKKGKEIVSRFDFLMEKKIRKEIRLMYPDYKIWGEEIGKEGGDVGNEKFIVIDPIDGTKNFLSGLPLFASQIACVENGEIVWGIINLPAFNEIYLAVKDVGAFLNGHKVRPSNQKSLNLSMQCFGIGHDANNFVKLPQIIQCFLAEPRHYGCAGINYAFVASGRTDIYIAEEAAFYDLAAGILLCKEAGLSMCRLNGGPYKIEEKGLGVVVANKSLIEQFKLIVKG